MIFSSPIDFQHRQRCFVRASGEVVYYVLEFSYRSNNPVKARLPLPWSLGDGLVDVWGKFFYPTFFAHCNRTFTITPGPDSKTYRGNPEQQKETLASVVTGDDGRLFIEWDLIDGWWRTMPVAWSMPAQRNERLWLPGRVVSGGGLVEYDHWYYVQDHPVKTHGPEGWDVGHLQAGISIDLSYAGVLVNPQNVMNRWRLAELRHNQDFYLDSEGERHGW